MNVHTIVNKKSGFTIIELTVSIGIVSTLVMLLVPAVMQTREASRKISCKNHLRQIGLGLHQYHTTHGTLPPAELNGQGGSNGCDDEEYAVEDNPGHCTSYQSWMAMLLPHIGQTGIWEVYDFNEPWCDTKNRHAIQKQISIYQCPSSSSGHRVDTIHVKGAAATDYGAIEEVEEEVYTEVFGVFPTSRSARSGVLAEDYGTRFEGIRDGLSYTIAVAECGGRPDAFFSNISDSQVQLTAFESDELTMINTELVVPEGVGWADPDSGIEIDGMALDKGEPYGPSMINATNVSEVFSFHHHGANLLFVDGSVRFLSKNIDAWTFISLCTKAGGEVVTEY